MQHCNLIIGSISTVRILISIPNRITFRSLNDFLSYYIKKLKCFAPKGKLTINKSSEATSVHDACSVNGLQFDLCFNEYINPTNQFDQSINQSIG